MNENIIKRIKSLPPLPKSITEIQGITSNPDGSIGDLIKVVKYDPMLTANLLKAANSPLYGFSRQIKTVDQAISLFGMSTVKGFAIASAVRSSMDIDLSAYGISEVQFVGISQLQNALITNWYKRDRSKLDILSPASFLLDIGAVAISSVLLSEGKTVEFKEKITSGADRSTLEIEYVGNDTASITAEIFAHWKFDDELVSAIKFSTHLEEAGESIHYAAPLNIVQIIVNMYNSFSEKSINEAMAIAEEYGLDTKTLEDAINTVK